jgi:hypothetical protein
LGLMASTWGGVFGGAGTLGGPECLASLRSTAAPWDDGSVIDKEAAAEAVRALLGDLEGGSVESTTIQTAYLRGALAALEALIADEDCT